MSNGSILLLREEVINQIAAGEVVENPASAVKELVENAIDAGALSIDIVIEQGGFELIRVEDNGTGMNREDALLSLQRHATSKIRSTEDLETLTSMGFRGEALAALAAISHLTIKSAPKEGGATCVRCDGGAPPIWEPVARNQGTTLEVRSLFYNVPARKHFQKSASASRTHILRTLTILSLAHPHIAFSLISDGRHILKVAPSTPLQRIEDLLSPSFLVAGFPLHRTSLPFHIHGYLTATSLAKKTRSHQYFFLNRRPLFSPLISRAVKEGYSTRLAEPLHPSFVLHLEGPPHLFDINVHPQKKEVRFQNEQAIFSCIVKAVSDTLHPPFLSPLLAFLTAPSIEAFPTSFSWQEPPPQQPPLFKEKASPLALFEHYLLLQDQALWRLVDLNAVRAEILLQSLQPNAPAMSSQSLLTPIEYTLSRDEALSIDDWIPEWEKIGLIARQIGKETIAIDGLPSWLNEEECIVFLSLWKEEEGSQDRTTRAVQRLHRGTKKRYTLEEGMALWERIAAQGEPKPPLSQILTSAQLATLFHSP